MTQSIGRYELRRELGRGGMATVFLAHDPRVDRDVALKLLPREFLHDPMFRARFEREAKTIAGLEHKAIVPLYDFGEQEGQPYLVMRYMPGGSLADRVKRGTLSLQETVRLFQRLASALDEAHSRGIIHRDLKPGNVLLDKDDEAYLSDFGIVKLSEATAALTGSGIIGTPAYMSPEQAEGVGEIDHRSDIYALGTILFECLTGRPPFQADTPMRVVVKHLKDPVPKIRELKPELPPAIEGVIQKALAKKPDQRYPSASALAEALAEVVEGRAPAMAPPIEPKKTLAVLPDREAPPAEPVPTAVEPLPGVKQEATRLVDTDAAPHLPDLPELGQPRERKGIPVWGWIAIGVVAIGILVGGIGGATGLFAAAPLPTPTVTQEPTPTKTRTPAPTASPALSSTPTATEISGILPEMLTELYRTSHDWNSYSYELVKWSPNGNRFAILGSQRGRDVIWIAEEEADWEVTHEIVVETLNLGLLTWSSSGQQIAASGATGLLQIWDVESGQELVSTPVTVGRVNALEWTEARDHFLTFSTDGWIKTWFPNGELDGFWHGHDNLGGYGSASFSPDGERIATIGSDGLIKVWTPYESVREESQRLCCHDTTRGRQVAWSPDGSTLASLSGPYGEMADLYLWDIQTEARLGEFNDYIHQVVWSPDGSQLAIAYYDRPAFAILNISTMELSPEIRIFDEAVWPDGSLYGGIDWSSDNHILTLGWGRNELGNWSDQYLVIWGMPRE